MKITVSNQDELKNQLKKRLKALRTSAGLSQKQLSDCTGIHYKQYQQYEYGSAFPPYSILVQLKDFWGIRTTDELVFGSNGLKNKTVSIDQLYRQATPRIKQVVKLLLSDY